MPRLVVHKRTARCIEPMEARIKAELAKSPDTMAGVKPMAGRWAGFFRLRHGELRVMYLHDRPNDTIVIAHVGPRGDVCK